MAKEAIDRISKTNDEGIDSKIEGMFMKIPLFDKVMKMVEDAERTSDFIIFVLVSPRDYRDAVRNAGNIAVTVGDRLKLDHAPLVAVRNDLFTKPGTFELNIIYSDEILEESPFDVNITINDHDYSFVKKNSRNIASTVAARLGDMEIPYSICKTEHANGKTRTLRYKSRQGRRQVNGRQLPVENVIWFPLETPGFKYRY